MRTPLLIGAMLVGLSWQASAHAFLQTAVPRVGSIARGVSTLRLTFTEALEPAFSRVTLEQANGTRVPGAHTAIDPRNPRVLIVRLPAPLPPGRYKVRWRVVSVDTHHTQGDYGFTIAP